MGLDELQVLLDKIVAKVTEEVTFANRCGEEELNEVLKKYGFAEEKEEEYPYIDLNSSKILIVGDSSIRPKDIQGICKDLGIEYDRLDMLPYEDAKNYKFKNLRFSPKYSDIIFGPVGHSARDMGDNSSIINFIRNNQDEYPKLTLASTANELKITKTTLKESLKNTRVYKEANFFSY